MARAKLWKALRKKSSIATVVVEYDGSGDSGEVTSVAAYNTKEEEVDLGRALTDLVSDFVYEYLPGGWEINEGSFGTCTIDVPNKKAHFEHSQRIESIEESSFDVEG